MMYLIWGLAVFLLFFNLGGTTLVNWDEAWFASVARDGMWNGQAWFYEPPLLTWVLSLMMKSKLSSEFWLRAFNAVCGLGIVVLVYKFAERLGGKNSGALATLIIISNIEFLFRARQINTDIPLTFFLLLVLYWAYDQKWLRSAFCFGLAFLTKRASWILALPALFLLRPKRDLQGQSLKVGVVFLATILPWIILSYLKHGDLFIKRFFVNFTVGKISTANPETGGNYLFYMMALKHSFKYWFIFLPLALWSKTKPLLVYVVTFLVFLTLAPIKASWYLLPVYPVLAVMLGTVLSKVNGQRSIVLLIVIVMASIQLIKYQDQYMVSCTTCHQVEIVGKAKKVIDDDSILYLDDDYLPVAVFYSGREVIPLRFDRAQRFDSKLEIENNSLLLSNTQTLDHLKQRLNQETKIVESTGDLLLLKLQ